MKLENLPNELLFLTFEYLYLHEIIYSFNKLNDRFRLLLLSYSPYYFDLSHPTIKFDFQIIKHLAPYFSSIKSLHVNDQDFLSKHSLNLFYTNLQSLSFDRFNDEQLISLIFLLPNFKQLKSLSFLKYNQINSRHWNNVVQSQIRSILIFQIKTLKILRWNRRESLFDIMNDMKYTEEKSTIEYFQFDSLDYVALRWLYFHTPNMKSLDVCGSIGRCFLCNETILDKLICLKFNHIHFMNCLELLQNITNSLMQLKELHIRGELKSESNTIFTNGDQWKNVIGISLPQLKVLKFFFAIYGKQEPTTIDELMQTFKTDFWIKEKKWFVVYDQEALTSVSYFYTIPCIDRQLKYSSSWKQISTTKQIDTIDTNRLTLISMNSEQISSLYCRFSHVQTLTLNNIYFDITYDQLDQLVKLSFVRKVIFQSEMNSMFFFDLLKHVNCDISICMNENYLPMILENVNENQNNYLKKINGLELKNLSNNYLKDDFIQKLCLYFPNVKELIIDKSLSISTINYLLNYLNKLVYLSVIYEDTNELKMLTKNLQLPVKKKLFLQRGPLLLEVFLSDSDSEIYINKNKRCNLL